MNYLDLFHGIGGFALGAHWAGMKFENHYCSDIEPYAQKLYKLRFPDSIQLGDITKINTEELKQYGDKWIITGGFPCQDISIAGKGAGITGTRSGLWFEYWRLIRDLRPEFAIMENVGALTFRGLDAVLGSLSEIGYDAEWQDIRASDMGAPHKRERIWIVAYPNGNKCSEQVRRKNEIETSKETKNGQNNNPAGEFSRTSPVELYIKRCQGEDVADTAESRLQKPQENKQQKSLLYAERGSAEIPDTNSQGLQGRTMPGESGVIGENGEQFIERQGEQPGRGYWSTEPAVGRLVNGLSGRVDRLKGLGNAIVPQIAQILFEKIKPLCN